MRKSGLHHAMETRGCASQHRWEIEGKTKVSAFVAGRVAI